MLQILKLLLCSSCSQIVSRLQILRDTVLLHLLSVAKYSTVIFYVANLFSTVCCVHLTQGPSGIQDQCYVPPFRYRTRKLQFLVPA
jgi:hypothetical protein